jgi:hypothetical protein
MCIDVKVTASVTVPLLPYEPLPGVGESDVFRCKACSYEWVAIKSEKVENYLDVCQHCGSRDVMRGVDPREGLT